MLNKRTIKDYLMITVATVIIGVFGCPEVEDRFGDTLQLFLENVVE